MEKLAEINTFPSQKKDGIFPLSDKGFKGTLVNLTLPSLHGGSLEIKLTVHLIKLIHHIK